MTSKITTSMKTTRTNRNAATQEHRDLGGKLIFKMLLRVVSSYTFIVFSMILAFHGKFGQAQLEPPKQKAERPLMPPPRIPPKVTHKVYMDFEVSDWNDDAQKDGLRLTMHMYGEQCPTAVTNFLHLCTGDLGTKGSISGKSLAYKESVIHRIVPHFMVQGGDFTHGSGVGGEAAVKQREGSLYFDDDPACLDKSIYTDKYFVSMANKGPDTNGSQFFITLVKTRWLDHKHMVFGRLALDDDFDDADIDPKGTDDENLEVLKQLESYGTSSGVPSKTIRITDCGILPIPSASESESTKETTRTAQE